MARIDLYEQQTGVSGYAAPGRDYIGESLEALGKTGMGVAARVMQVEDERSREQVYTQASKARAEWTNYLTEAYSKAPLGAAGVNEEFQQKFNEYVAKGKETVPANQQDLYERLMADIGGNLSILSMKQTVASRHEQAKVNYESAVTDDIGAIS